MGRAGLLVVLGVGVAISYIGHNVTSSLNRLTEAQTGYFRYSQARNYARTAVYAALRTYDQNARPSFSPSYISGGYYQVTDTMRRGDTLWLATRGFYEDSSYTLRIKLLLSTKPFPEIRSALAIRATPVSVTSNGRATIDGRNYDATGATLTNSGDMPGVTTWTSSDAEEVDDEMEDDIYGSPPIKVDQQTANPLDYIDEYIANADFQYSPGTYAGISWGSVNDPRIIVCDAGNDTANSKIKFAGNVTGYGILAVRGSLEVTGSFSFHGLVVVFGTTNQISLTSSGTPQIVGGTIVAGTGAASLRLNGSGQGAKFKYSSAALQNARAINRLRYYKILDWYE